MDSTLLSLAILPGVALLVLIYKKDKVEKEPLGLLVLLLLAGIAAALCSIVLEILFEIGFSDFHDGSFFAIWIEMFFGVALIEEGTKYFLMNLLSWNNKHFNCSFDGIVYAVFVSLGFAIFENILYVSQSGLMVAIARSFTAVPSHMINSIFMGLFYSKAKKLQIADPNSNYRIIKWLGLFFASITHGIYDFILSIEIEYSLLIFIVFLIFSYGLAFYIVVKESKADRYLS